MKKILFLLSFVFVFLNATVVKEIKFEGLLHISESVAKEIIDIPEGSKIDIEKIDRSIKKLYKQQYFMDIWVTEDVGILTYHFKEKAVIANVTLEGLAEGNEEQILDAIGVNKGDIYDKKKIDTAKAEIIKFLEHDGYFDSTVEVVTEEINPGSLKLELIVSKGEEVHIRNVNVCGAKEFDYDDFEPAIQNKEEEFWGWMWGRNDGKLKVGDLRFDPSKIRDVYMKNGYLDAKVSLPFLRTYFDGYFADISYIVEEGKIYTIKSVGVKLKEPVVKVEELEEGMKLEAGDIFNVEKLRADVKRIEDTVADLGYAYVKVYPDVKQDRQNYTADITLLVEPGNKIYINDIRISGNSRTIDRVVRREMYLSEGGLYSRTDLTDSKNALKRTGFFEDVLIEEKKVAKDKIDLIVKVKEASTGSISGGIGFGSYDGFLLSAGVSDRNVFGSGITLETEIDYSEKTLEGGASFINPRLFDSQYSLAGRAYKSSHDFYDYDEEKSGFTLTLGRKFRRYVQGSVTYQLETSELANMSDSLDPDLYRGGEILKSAITPVVTFDNTDDYYLPRSGFAAKAGVEYAGIGGDQKYVSNFYNFAYYYGLLDQTDYDLILRYKARFKIGWDNGYFPLNEKYYMGGAKSVRGYKGGSLSPKNSSGDLTGGDMMFANSIEASIPLIESAGMRINFFLDYGMIGEDDFDIKRLGTGTGLEWFSPFGPLQVIFALPLNKEEGDKVSNFEFSMGRRF